MKATTEETQGSSSSSMENDHAGDIVTHVVPTHRFPVGCQNNSESSNSWFIPSQIPPDLSIEVQGITYNVHKYPLISKCGYMGELQMQQPSISNSTYQLKLENFPGGSETFQTVLRFCYCLPVDFNSYNIAALRCASEFLEMTEELEDGNLISKTEAFLTFVVLCSWKDTIAVLKSCEALSPWAENLQIVRRCCESVAWKVSKESLAVEKEEEGWWLDDVNTLRIDHFMRIIAAIPAKGANPETMGKCIVQYARRWLPGLDSELESLRGYGQGKNGLMFGVGLGICVSNGKEETSSAIAAKEQRKIIESLISILPPQQEGISCEFLLKMLKMAMVFSASSALIAELEKRVGIMLEDANVNDLLIPRCTIGNQGNPQSSPEECTVHDVDVVQRIIEYFLMQEQHKIQKQKKLGKQNVSKVLDNYLAEIAKDPYLSVTKFQVLAESLPENLRSCDDGLYRAIDTYLKSHPVLCDHERRRLCKIMNCEKLSVDACAHAAQNDRLPLRTVVQVLFSEQMKMRATMEDKETSVNVNSSEEDKNQSTTDFEMKSLKAELENVKVSMQELQNDYMELQKEYDKLNRKPRNLSRWSFGWRKIKSSFQAKVDEDEHTNEQNTQTAALRMNLRRRLSMP